ncbi:hypothetical protein [Paenibacillus bouchesdurhonensis]|uniref:hypothetical protein n=1 Tax=Paenibacillus bouchesdurhonensis TaxID=1870990 RepID=UPI000DA608AC|nr:hypothetical protein [Paenibacillus bouchesdurhonensis]
MKNCSACRSVHVQQKSSVFARLFISIYMVLAFYFFTGEMSYGALIVFISLVIPYWHVCSDCNKSFVGRPRIHWNSLWVGSYLEKYLLALLPSILTMTALILNFPHTGLERIAYLPAIFFMNSLMIVIYLYQSKRFSKTLNLVFGVILLIITVALSVLTYPQEHGEGILELLFSKQS